MRSKWLYRVCVSLLICLLGFVSFYKTDISPIRDWDEARHGVSAYEMLQTREWVVTTYRYKPDYWNLKPPLSEYLIALGYRVFGYNGLGLRFFSGLSWVLCAVAGAMFVKKNGLGRVMLLTVLVGYAAATLPLSYHCVRTGDADAYLCLQCAAAQILMMRYDGGKARYLYGACLCFSLAFLTKSWHSGIIALTVLLCLLIDGKLFSLGWKKAFLCLGCALGPILLWMALRYSKDGFRFFTTMFEIDLVKRSATVLEEHDGGVLYYVQELLTDPASVGFILLAAMGLVFSERNQRTRKVMRVGLLGVLIPMVSFSLVRTKLLWYIVGIYPALIMLAGLGAQGVVLLARPRWLRALILAIPSALLLLAVGTNVRSLAAIQPGEMERDILANTERGAVEPRTRIYKNLNPLEEEKWLQREVLLLEWAGDYLPVNGDEAKWAEDGDGLLLVKNEHVAGLDADYERVVYGDQYSVIRHLKSTDDAEEHAEI